MTVTKEYRSKLKGTLCELDPSYMVVKEIDFWDFIDNYPRKLQQDQFPEFVHSFNDFTNGKKWPESVVARIASYDEKNPSFQVKLYDHS